MSIEENLKNLAKKDLESFISKDEELKKLYNLGTCKIRVDRGYLGPGEYDRKIGPKDPSRLDGFVIYPPALSKIYKEEKAEKIELNEDEAVIDVHVIWGPLAARGFSLYYKKGNDEWKVQEWELCWES